jgi:DNA-binding NarL/FixJ family response regulator
MAHNYRIQIVEDQYFVAMDCQQALEDAGFECTGLAASAERALELVARDQPDLLLMDIRLSGPMDGVEVATRIFKDHGIRSVFSSAHADPATRRRAEHAHPLGWLQKPFTPDHLIEAVRVAVEELEREASATLTTSKAASAGRSWNRDWS